MSRKLQRHLLGGQHSYSVHVQVSATLLSHEILVDTRLPSCVQEQSFTDVEMPGQYLGTAEVSPDSVVYLERFGANVGIVRRHATSYRRLALNGSNGKTVHFLVQTGQHWSTPCGGPPPLTNSVAVATP